ncbi:MAG: dynein light intermediate chain-domain-containing protein [Piptocephalis tieghemiana]|nr:MAG: dynein light intermediate chain-domain-containing protein [Piptocephalis tieghemiana]
MPPTVSQVAFSNPGSTPAGPSASAEESIWTGILQSLGSSKAVLPRRLLVLGDPNSGKSVLVQNLKRDHRPFLQPPSASGTNTASTSTSDHVSSASQGMGTSSTDPSGGLAAVNRVEQSELALSYTYTDIRDEEDTVSRVGIYQLAASHPTLLPFALNADSLSNTAVIIVLDWQRPWSWVESLQRWLRVLTDGVAQIAQEGQVQGGGPGGWSKGQVVVENAKEHLERFLQLYTEPSSSAAATASGTTDREGTMEVGTSSGGPGEEMGKEVLLPLPEGCLTHNLGVPVVVVCTKADGMRTLEREQDYRDEQFDHIQQSLRTLCLAYGAALFHTTTHRPRTFALLRAYLLHRLLGPGSALPTSLLFRYPYRAQVVEREMVAVPSGWDTWGKIGILREGFQCRETLDAWEVDLAEQGNGASGHGAMEEGGLRQMYERTIRDSSVGVRRDTKKEAIVAESEQDFLVRQQEVLKRAKASASTESHSSYAPGGNPASQNEVLANFFQSLLSKKTSTGPGSGSGPVGGDDGVVRHQAAEELDRMKQSRMG